MLVHSKLDLFDAAVEFNQKQVAYCQTLQTDVSRLLGIHKIINGPSGNVTPEKSAAEEFSYHSTQPQIYHAESVTYEHSPTSIQRNSSDRSSAANDRPISSDGLLTPKHKETVSAVLTESALKAFIEENHADSCEDSTAIFGITNLNMCCVGSISSSFSSSPAGSISSSGEF